MEKKITKRDRYETLLTYAEVQNDAAMVEFIEHEIKLLDKKRGGERKPTALQIENENLKNAIVAALEPNRVYTVSEIIKEVPECNGRSTQKIAPLMSAMCKEDDGRIVRLVEKRTALFQLA